MGIERARELRKRMPAPEAKLWNALRDLRPLGFHFRRQVPLGPYYADFVCHARRLVIEVDGDTHGVDAALHYDARRDAFIAAEGYRVLRVANSDVMHNIDGVTTIILSALSPPPPSLPPHKGEGSLAGGSEDILP
ncbi:endonuclease domain-containing protein [Devosia sp. A449]